jgi:hypothetical protein
MAKGTVHWRLDTNPAHKLRTLQFAASDSFRLVPNQFATELGIIVTCEALGKVMQYKTNLYVHVDVANHRINQITG